MRVQVAVWSKEKVDWGSLISVHGLGECGQFPEWCLCRNLSDTSIHLPLVVLPKGLGLTWDVGALTQRCDFWLAGCSLRILTHLPAAVCAGCRFRFRLPLGGVRTQGECKSHSIQFPHPQPAPFSPRKSLIKMHSSLSPGGGRWEEPGRRASLALIKCS